MNVLTFDIEQTIKNQALIGRYDLLKNKMPEIEQKVLKYLTSRGRGKIRSGYKKAGIKTRSKDLYNAIYGSAKKNGHGYFGIISKQKYKFVTINNGATIYPKGNYLSFITESGNYVRTRSVTIRPHDFFTVALRYMGSEEMNRDVTKVFERELAKMYKI